LEEIRVEVDRKTKEKAKEKKRQVRVCKSKCTLQEEIKNARQIDG
jgi:hypothetical protein